MRRLSVHIQVCGSMLWESPRGLSGSKRGAMPSESETIRSEGVFSSMRGSCVCSKPRFPEQKSRAQELSCIIWWGVGS